MFATAGVEVTGDGDAKGRDLSHQRIRRRNRMITSCLECRRRKLKCDKSQPCTNCTKFSRDCMFLAPALDSVSQKKLNELKEKMGSLEKVLEDDIARRTSAQAGSVSRRKSSVGLPGEDSASDQEIPVPDDEKELDASPMCTFDTAYEDNGDGDVLDIGIRVGMLRITERIGGMARPRFSEEMAYQIGKPIRNVDDPDYPKLPDHNDFATPGPTYIAPGTGFVFGDVGQRRNLIDFLPTKTAADALVQQYYRNCHMIARAVHWPSFQSQYESFWGQVLSGIEPHPPLQALIMSVLFSAVVSMKDDQVTMIFGDPRTSVLLNFQLATEVALNKANFLRTTRLETLQALVIYLLPMCRDALSRAHLVLVGMTIRLAECMGLHRDPAEHFAMNPVEAHVRRIIWFQICFLDYHTGEKQGPRPSIKRDDYDTQFPANLSDADLMLGVVEENESVWTEMTVTRLRFECCEMWRVARMDIERLHLKKITVTHALSKVESFRKAMEAKYHKILDTTVPIQRYAKLVLSNAMYKMHVMILSRYHNATEVRIPDRLRQIIITTGVQFCEDAMELYKDKDFQDWAWYNAALHAWATAMLLLSEIFNFPQRREADRIWRCLDFVFKPDLSLSREDKAIQIISAVRDRTAFYRDLRGVRVPVSMQNRLATSLPIRAAPGPRMDGPDMILARPVDKDAETAQTPKMKRGSQSSIHDDQATLLSAPQLIPSSRESPPKESAATWTFDTAFTSYAPRIGHTTAQRSRTVSLSPAAPKAVINSVAVTSMAPYMPHDNVAIPPYGGSPSNSSSTETWPPAISNEQATWPYPFATTSVPPQPNQISSQEAYNQLQTIPSTHATSSMISGTYTQPNNNTSPHYMPSVNEANPLPVVTGVTTAPIPTSAPTPSQSDTMMVDINWAEWDKIFPPDSNNGNLDKPNYQAG